jgi:hypothetical protein
MGECSCKEQRKKQVARMHPWSVPPFWRACCSHRFCLGGRGDPHLCTAVSHGCLASEVAAAICSYGRPQTSSMWRRGSDRSMAWISAISR